MENFVCMCLWFCMYVCNVRTYVNLGEEKKEKKKKKSFMIEWGGEQGGKKGLFF